MNILLVYKEADIATYKMLEGLSKLEDFNIYIASPQSYTDKKIYGNCTPLDLPVITSKFNWNVIRALRKIIKTYRIDLIYSPSSSGLSNALFASIGTRAKNIAYRGTQAKLKRFDPTYYLGILNPAVEHVVCEPKDIEEYLSRFIARKRLTTSTKPFDIDWIKEAVRTPKQADDIPDDAFRCIYIGATKNRPFKGLTDLIDAFILLDDPRVHLTIVGEYGENDFQLAQQSKVSAQIHFLGQRSDAISFLVTSQLFILPSHRDASPRVVREAMACSVPCIVTDIPGARDLIIDGVTGLLVPPSSPQQMAASIRSLIDNPERLEAFAKASREHIIQDFSVKAYTDGFATLFRSIKKA